MPRETAGASNPLHEPSKADPGRDVRASNSERKLVSAAWAQFELISNSRGIGGSSFQNTASPRTQHDPAPLHVPGYRVLGEVHRGGQGVVYQAIQESTLRKKAIKVLKEGPFAEASERLRFDREIDLLSRLDHPHIVGIHDHGTTAGHAYYVMDYIAGQPLDAYVAGADLSIDELLRLFALICDAVNVAHLRGVIHRDLKPGNIRIDEEGQPRILDFGLAKWVQEAAERSSARGMTMTGQFVGSLPWASPEQAGGDSDLLDIRTDVYSLGVILYQLVTGRFPYPVSGRIDDVVRHIVHTSPARPSSIRRDLDRDVETIILKCLSKEPEQRYQSAGELVRDIRLHLANEPILATPPSTGYRLRKFVRRNRGLVVAGAVVAAALLLGSGVSIAFGIREIRARRTAENALTRAETAEQETQARADELAKVASFQQVQLSGINAQTMGVKLRGDLLEKARAAAKASNLPPDEVEARVAELEKLVAGSDFTGLALESLDENFFQPALRAIDDEFADQPLVRARLLQTSATTLRDLGLLDAATAPQEEALAIRRRELGDEHPDTLDSMKEMGYLFWAQGNFPEAEPHLRAAMEKRRSVLGNDHPDTLDSIDKLGILLRDQGKLLEAEAYVREALDGRRRVLGEEHSDTLASLVNMGMLLKAQGKVAETEAYDREALEKYRRVLGDDHPHTIIAINNMAVMLYGLGKMAEAEDYYREALERYRRVLGDEHPDTLTAISNIAMLLKTAGRMEEAEVFAREAVEKRRRVLGDDHPHTLMAISNLGTVLQSAGKLEEAEVSCREALDKRRRVLGEEHQDTLTSLGNLSLLQLTRGKLTEAEESSREALAIRRRTLGDEHPYTVNSINTLGAILRQQGKFAEAEAFSRESLEIRRRLLGDEHPDTLNSLFNLAGLLRAQNKLTEAEPYSREALEKCRRVLGDQHLLTLSAIGNMSGLLLAQARPQEAIDLLGPTEAAARRVFTGSNAIRLGLFLSILGRARNATGEFAAAEASLTEAHTILIGATGARPQDVAEVATALAALYDAWHAAEPNQGYDAKAAEWRATTQPSQ
ncbi:MAG TPA: serine/threonine-protein kinase [Phycisphaerae bacterium]|nr:serine/threonine-protein kinase [Phycisphaerae bacterium]